MSISPVSRQENRIQRLNLSLLSFHPSPVPMPSAKQTPSEKGMDSNLLSRQRLSTTASPQVELSSFRLLENASKMTGENENPLRISQPMSRQREGLQTPIQSKFLGRPLDAERCSTEPSTCTQIRHSKEIQSPRKFLLKGLEIPNKSPKAETLPNLNHNSFGPGTQKIVYFKIVEGVLEETRQSVTPRANLQKKFESNLIFNALVKPTSPKTITEVNWTTSSPKSTLKLALTSKADPLRVDTTPASPKNQVVYAFTSDYNLHDKQRITRAQMKKKANLKLSPDSEVLKCFQEVKTNYKDKLSLSVQNPIYRGILIHKKKNHLEKINIIKAVSKRVDPKPKKLQ